MKNKHMENRIQQAFRNATPDILDSVLSDCEKQKETTTPVEKKQRGNKRWVAVAAMAAALALVIGLGFGFSAYQQEKIAMVKSTTTDPKKACSRHKHCA